MLKKIQAFTIMEVIIVVVLFGIIAGFGVPNYIRAMSKSEERTLITNLITIRAATDVYIVNTRTANVPNMGNVQTINDTLGISIVASNITYACVAATNTCRVTHPNGYSIHFHRNGAHNSDGSLHCNSANCPNCPDTPGDCG